jgi:hypothetical protein
MNKKMVKKEICLTYRSDTKKGSLKKVKVAKKLVNKTLNSQRKVILAVVGGLVLVGLIVLLFSALKGPLAGQAGSAGEMCVQDISANLANGLLGGGVICNSGSCTFNGNGNSYIELTGNEIDPLLIEGDKTILMSVRLNPDALVGVTPLFHAESDERIFYQMYLQGGQLYYRGSGVRDGSFTTLQAGRWYNLAIVQSGTSVNFFLNGESTSSRVIDGTDYSEFATKRFRVGEGLDGKMRNLKIYRRALTFDEIFEMHGSVCSDSSECEWPNACVEGACTLTPGYCQYDVDCESPRVCDVGGTNQCQLRPGTCSTTEDCPGQRICIDSICEIRPSPFDIDVKSRQAARNFLGIGQSNIYQVYIDSFSGEAPRNCVLIYREENGDVTEFNSGLFNLGRKQVNGVDKFFLLTEDRENVGNFDCSSLASNRRGFSYINRQSSAPCREDASKLCSRVIIDCYRGRGSERVTARDDFLVACNRDIFD